MEPKKFYKYLRDNNINFESFKNGFEEFGYHFEQDFNDNDIIGYVVDNESERHLELKLIETPKDTNDTKKVKWYHKLFGLK